MTNIPLKSARRLLESVAFLNFCHGETLNGLLTVNFEQLGVDGEQEAKAALTSINQMIARKLREFAIKENVGAGEHHYVYAHECNSTHGWHVHELVVIDQDLRFEVGQWLKTWVARNFPNADEKAVHFRPSMLHHRDRDAIDDQTRMVGYILKTTVPGLVEDREGQLRPLHDVLGLKRIADSQDFDIIRPTGSSQSISRRAQLDAGFVAPRNWDDLLSNKMLYAHRAGQTAQDLYRQLLAIGA